jgi:hypothetical protein
MFFPLNRFVTFPRMRSLGTDFRIPPFSREAKPTVPDRDRSAKQGKTAIPTMLSFSEKMWTLQLRISCVRRRRGRLDAKFQIPRLSFSDQP